MCDKATGAFLPTLKFVLDWFVNNTILKKVDEIFFGNADSNIIRIPSNDIGFNTIYLSNVNLDEDNFDENNPETIIYVKIMA